MSTQTPRRKAPCTACGALTALKPEEHRLPKNIPHRPRGLSFTLQGCRACGHIMAEEPDRFRCLTRAEADELRNSPEWDRVRGVVEDAVRGMWG